MPPCCGWGDSPLTPPLWIPAFAGMTVVGVCLLVMVGGTPPTSPLWIPAFAGMTEVGVRLLVVVGGDSPLTPPLWIPAFAGMTVEGVCLLVVALGILPHPNLPPEGEGVILLPRPWVTSLAGTVVRG